MPLMPLAADWVELIAKGIPVLLFIFWLISQAVGEAQAKPKLRPPQAGPRPPARPQPRAGQPPNVLDEMEAFLRRAAEKRDRARSPMPRSSRSPRQPSDRLPNRSAKRRDRCGKRRRSLPQFPRRRAETSPGQSSISQSDAYGPSSTATSGGLTARHAIGSRSFGQRISHLGERVADADDRLEARLEGAFDHSVGSLSHQNSPQPEPPSSTAAAIARMLDSPENVRQAIILNEILRRPAL